jgi:hypothetical protein
MIAIAGGILLAGLGVIVAILVIQGIAAGISGTIKRLNDYEAH